MATTQKVSAHVKSAVRADIFNKAWKKTHWDLAAKYKSNKQLWTFYDLPLIAMISRLRSTKKTDFTNVAFIGNNPSLFLRNAKEYPHIESFTFVQTS